MPLRIDTSKCKDIDTNYMRIVADTMYAVGVGQIRNEDEARKLYRRYYMLRLSRNDIPHAMALVPYSVFHSYIGAHTNVSDVSDFQFGKSLLLEMNRTAEASLARAIREGL